MFTSNFCKQTAHADSFHLTRDDSGSGAGFARVVVSLGGDGGGVGASARAATAAFCSSRILLQTIQWPRSPR